MIGLFRVALQPIVKTWGRQVLRNFESLPRPLGDPRAHASGDHSDRILLFGSGASVGWGVASQDLALPGSLAREISRATGRGTDVDVVSDSRFTAAQAIRDLTEVNLWRYDAIVLTMGLNEAVGLGSLKAWRRDYDALLDYVVSHKSARARIFTLGIHSLTSITRYDAIMGPIAATHRRALNRVSRQLGDHGDRASFIEFDPVRTKHKTRTRTADDYRTAARIVAAVMAPELNFGFELSSVHSRDVRASGNDETARQTAVDALNILDTVPEERFERIVAFAQRAFGTSSAAMTIIDRDRQWQKAGRGDERNTERAFAICSTTIEQSGALVVADASLDARFDKIPFVDGEPAVRFYAGFPIEAPTGERIGALCVFDTASRDVSGVDRSLLRDLALMVQKEVWQRAVA